MTATATVPPLPVIGGADKIAFIRENDIWTVNVDGDQLKQWTDDGGEKTNLQWMPDGDTLLYTSGSTIRTVNIATNVTDIFATFSNPIKDFRISPSGKQLAISLNGELFIVPFTDPQKIREARTRDQLNALKTCAYTSFAVSGIRWSEDETRVAIKLLIPINSLQVDAIRLLELKSCTAILSADFPAARFEMGGDNELRRNIGAYDWDGSQLFLLSNAFRNENFGYIYKYDLATFRRTEYRPVDNSCCYRAPAWSPDKNYVLFFFQDVRLAPAGTTVMYYVPLGDLESGARLKPFPFPTDFFSKRLDDPIAVLRPERKP
jgi:dipeptidyl aminopeptidase/acylaminoacyl peptidase